MLAIDFHAHILPEMDHGCEDLQQALAQLALAKEAGVEIVVATPHFYPQNETVASFLRRRKIAMSRLAKARGGGVQLHAGAEVLLCPRMEKMEGVECLCIEGTHTLLVEMPLAVRFDLVLTHTAAALKQKGLQVVLAHAERYRRSETEKLLKAGIPVQIDADYYRSIRKKQDVGFYLRQDAVVALGSDIHGLGRHYQQYAVAVRKLGVNAPLIMKRAGRLIGVGS